MEKFFNFWKQNWKTVLWTTLVVGLVLLVPIIIDAKNPVSRIRWWYFMIIIAYSIVGCVLANKTNIDNFSNPIGKILNILRWVNIALVIIFSIAGVWYMFDNDQPLIISSMFCSPWMWITFFILLLIIAFVSSIVVLTAKEDIVPN